MTSPANTTRRAFLRAIPAAGAAAATSTFAAQASSETCPSNDAILKVLSEMVQQADAEFISLMQRRGRGEDVETLLNPSIPWNSPDQRAMHIGRAMAFLPADTPVGVGFKEAALDEREYIPIEWNKDGTVGAWLGGPSCRNALLHSIEADRRRLGMVPSGRGLEPVESMGWWEA